MTEKRFSRRLFRSITIVKETGRPRNSLGQIGNIAAKSVTDLTEDRESQISFAALDSSKIASVQSTILGEVILAKSQDLAFGLNSVAQPQEFYVVDCHTLKPNYHVAPSCPSLRELPYTLFEAFPLLSVMKKVCC
jgi:hypothetical protein